MIYSLLITGLAIICLIVCPGVSADAFRWILQRDNLSEYAPIASSSYVRRVTECLMLLENYPTAQAAAFDTASGECRPLRCLLGQTGCRKCRNTRNNNMTLMWVQPVSSGSNCWATFQRRVDDTLSFNRNWTEFAAGFGQGEDRNFWMGLGQLQQLTETAGCGNASLAARCRIRWEFSDWNDTWYWAENSNLYIGSAADKYRLNMAAVDPSRSNVGQIPQGDLNGPANRQFSTIDSDNDILAGDSCARLFGCGWWFGHCTSINANGHYVYPPKAFNTLYVMYYFATYPGTTNPLANTYSMKTFEILVIVA